MSPIRALLPILALSGVLLSLAPAAQAGPPPWAASHGYGHGDYSPRRDDGDRREERGRRDERYHNGYYQGVRRDDHHGDYHWGGYYRSDYPAYYRNYRYPAYRGYGGYSGYNTYNSYNSYNSYSGHDGYRGYDGGGRCGTDGALTVVGAVAGGIIGNHSASRGNRDVGTVVGAIAGGLLGNAIGSSIDDGNRACGGYWRAR